MPRISKNTILLAEETLNTKAVLNSSQMSKKFGGTGGVYPQLLVEMCERGVFSDEEVFVSYKGERIDPQSSEHSSGRAFLFHIAKAPRKLRRILRHSVNAQKSVEPKILDMVEDPYLEFDLAI